jgi:single stranded DNA-binding protein
MYINEHVLSGNVGADATLRDVGGKQVLSFRMASTSPYKDKRTTWYNVSLWGTQAATLAPRVLKGTQVVVSGSSDAREYEDKNGNQRVAQEFNARSVQLVSRREAVTAGGGDEIDDDIDNPF